MARSSGIGALGNMGGDGPERRKRVLEEQRPRPGAMRTTSSGETEQFVETRGMKGADGPFGWIKRALGPDEGQSIGRLARPTGDEPPPRDNAEFQARVQRNAQWAQAPEVQAAMLQFAINMMQPVNSPQDLMLNLSQGVGGAFQAASRVREGTLEEQKAAREAELEERKMRVQEGGLTVQEKKLAIDQAELGLKLKKGTTKSVVVAADDAINSRFKLGIPKGSQAKVQITVDDDGKVTDASVEAGFEGGSAEAGTSVVVSGDDELNKKFNLGIPAGSRAKVKLIKNDKGEVISASVEAGFEAGESGKEKSSPLEQLQIDRAEAEARGDKRAVAELDLQIKTQGAGASGVTEGTVLVPDPSHPSGFRAEIIPGSEADKKRIADEKAADAKWAEGSIAAATVAIHTKKAMEILDRNPMPDLTVSGIGGLIAELPLPSDAKAMKLALDTIKSNVTIQVLTAMRQASPTGAAVGNVSDYEDRIMQSKLGTLDQYGDAGTLRENLHRVAATMRLIVDDAAIAKIGEQVKAGILTNEQGLLEVERLIDADITKETEAKQEQEREAARAGSAGLQAPEFSPKLTGAEPISPNPQPMTMATPIPPPPAMLSPEEQQTLDVHRQMEQLITEEADKPDPTMPLDLNEEDQALWPMLSPEKRKLFVRLQQESKNKKKRPNGPPGVRHQGPLGGDSLDSQESLDADALRLWDQIQVAPKAKPKPGIQRSSKEILEQSKSLFKGK